MKKTLFALCSLVLAFASCSESSPTSSQTISVPVKVSSDPTVNFQIASDVASFDFRREVFTRMNVTDSAVLAQIYWAPIKDSLSNAVHIDLEVGKNAKHLERSLEKLFTTFFETKVKDYSNNTSKLTEIEVAAKAYMRLIEAYPFDSIWPRTSPTLLQFATREEFEKTIDKRKQLFRPLGKRSISNRKLDSVIGNGIKGDFVTVTFTYQNYAQEELTLEKSEGVYKLLGYHFLYVPKDSMR